MPWSPACTTTSSPLSNSTSDRLPVVASGASGAAAASVTAPTRSVCTPRGSDASRKVPAPAKT
jgi:hypothetical protein